MKKTDYSILNKDLPFDCIETLKATDGRGIRYIRFFNSNTKKGERFLSYYEVKKYENSSWSKEKRSMWRGVSIQKGDKDLGERLFKLLPKSTKELYDSLCEFEIKCEKELVAQTPSRRFKNHVTMLKSNHFKVDNCLEVYD